MRVAVIGATGHIGSFLVPRLVAAGHEVIALSRGAREPYVRQPAGDRVRRIAVDRAAEDRAGVFGARIAALHADAVVDLLCFTTDSATQLLEALRGTETLLLHCGTIWVHGHATVVPATEESPRNAFGAYGIAKAAIEKLLIDDARAAGVRSAVLHPGHISGPGWAVVNPAGNLDLRVWEKLASGQPLVLPNFGLETVHHVHADDVAQAFERALAAGNAAVGESFHVVSDGALTLRGFAESVAGWFGRGANLAFAPFEEFAAQAGEEHAPVTLDHISHSPSVSNAKARAALGFTPRYSSLAAAAEAVRWLVGNEQIAVPQMTTFPAPREA
jgi:nucleoside-diphosphate-sugar epimerase